MASVKTGPHGIILGNEHDAGEFKFEAAALILALVRPEDGHDLQAARTELLTWPGPARHRAPIC